MFLLCGPIWLKRSKLGTSTPVQILEHKIASWGLITQSTANPREVYIVSWTGSSEAEPFLGLFSICVVNDFKLQLPYLRSSDRSKVNDSLGRCLGNVGVSHANYDKHKAVADNIHWSTRIL